MSKALESLNLSSLKEQISELDQQKADRSELSSIKDGSSSSGGQIEKITGQLKKLGHQMMLNQDEINERNEKEAIKFNEAVYKVDSNQRKLDFIETVINSMKKRMTDLGKQGKDNQAQLANSTGGQKSLLDTEEGQQQLAQLEKLSLDMQELKKNTDN